MKNFLFYMFKILSIDYYCTVFVRYTYIHIHVKVICIICLKGWCVFVCFYAQFYDLISVTTTESKGGETLKVTKIRKKARVIELPNITLCNFLKMAKEGNW